MLGGVGYSHCVSFRKCYVVDTGHVNCWFVVFLDCRTTTVLHVEQSWWLVVKGPLIQHTTQLIWDVSLTIPNPSLNLMHLSPVLRFMVEAPHQRKDEDNLLRYLLTLRTWDILPYQLDTVEGNPEPSTMPNWHFKKITPKNISLTHTTLAPTPSTKTHNKKSKKRMKSKVLLFMKVSQGPMDNEVRFLPWKSASVLHIDLQPTLKLPVILHQQQLGLHLSSWV